MGNEQLYYDTLKKIARGYDRSEKIIRNAEKQYGLDALEALECVYDNIQTEAAIAIKGKRRPKTND